MGTLTTRLLDLWMKVLHWFYRVRYGPVARQLGAAAEDGRRGFVIVQIDGLGYGYLRDAIDKGYAPFLGSLLASGQASLYEWFTGLPSTTPAVQAGIMYGNDSAIPGFRWYEKGGAGSVVCKSPAFMHRLQEEISQGHRGILEDGSSYANMYDGGASTSLFTLSAIGRNSSMLQRLRGLGVFLVLLFSPVRTARFVWLALSGYVIGVVRSVASLFWPSKFGRLGVLTPLYDVAVDVLVREVETFSVLVDLYRALPAIYVNYSSYDNWAHRFGPADSYAYRALRAIDARIQQIDRMRRRVRRAYDLYVLSDHGMAPCVPFDAAYGVSLGQVVVGSIDRPVIADEFAQSPEDSLSTQLLGHEAAIVGKGLTGLQSGAARTLHRSIEKRQRPEPMGSRGGSEIVVRNSGPLSHVYFTTESEPLTAAQIEERYPGLMERLANHPGISLVAARGSDSPVVTAPGTRPSAGTEAARRAFSALKSADRLAESLARLVQQRHAGDLVLLGRWGLWGDSQCVVSFEHQRGTHGGAGGGQCQAFVLALSPDHPDLSGITRSEQLYTLFCAYRQSAPPATVPSMTPLAEG